MTQADPTLFQKLDRLLADGEYVLFLGAGASMEAGLASWVGSLRKIAEDLRARAPTYAKLMDEEVARGRLLHAAQALYMADITTEERAAILTRAFGGSTTITARLRSLVTQRYRAVVTTNYDRVFIEAASRAGVDLIQYCESPDDMAAARVSRERFILRMHGRMEVPGSIVISQSHYDKLRDSQEYVLFVQSLLSSASVVFFGFSFADAFFEATLQNFRLATRGRMQHQSFALLAESPTERLRDLLSDLNIVPVVYSPDNRHEQAWDVLTRPRSAPSVNQNYGETRMRHQLASVLAHLRLQRDTDLRSAVVTASVEACLRKLPDPSLEDAIESARLALALPPSRTDVVKNAIAKLINDRRIALVNDRLSVAVTGRADGLATGDLDLLVRGVVARTETRYRQALTKSSDFESAIREALLRVFVADGLALAHSFIRRTKREVGRVETLVADAVANAPANERVLLQSTSDAMVALLTRPDRAEEEALDELAAIAFSLCLTVTEPGVIALGERIANRDVFLDASIVLPWLSSGHPSEAFYASVVDSFGRSCLADGYVNEIVSHRALAVEEFKAAGLEDPKRLKRYAQFYSLNNVNTYIGGYGGRVSAGYDGSFEDYLSEVAPFENDADAAKYVEKRGLAVRPLETSTANVPAIKIVLDGKFEEYGRPRNPIRVRHDAQMIGHVLARPSGTRPFFVTADRSLVSAIGQSIYSSVLPSLIFPHQAFALAQLAGRVRGVVRGLARTVFGMGQDASRQLREFYIDRVLAEYEPALVSEIPAIVEAIVDVAEELRASRGDEDEAESVNARVRKFTALDQFEGEFHAKMAQARKAHDL